MLPYGGGITEVVTVATAVVVLKVELYVKLLVSFTVDVSPIVWVTVTDSVLVASVTNSVAGRVLVNVSIAEEIVSVWAGPAMMLEYTIEEVPVTFNVRVVVVVKIVSTVVSVVLKIGL